MSTHRYTWVPASKLTGVPELLVRWIVNARSHPLVTGISFSAGGAPM
jgi:hypothetical protein